LPAGCSLADLLTIIVAAALTKIPCVAEADDPREGLFCGSVGVGPGASIGRSRSGMAELMAEASRLRANQYTPEGRHNFLWSGV